jgi:hypothetical protein
VRLENVGRPQQKCGPLGGGGGAPRPERLTRGGDGVVDVGCARLGGDVVAGAGGRVDQLAVSTVGCRHAATTNDVVIT